MPKEFGRNQRISQFVKEELAVLIQKKFPMQHYGMITVSEVDVSPDLKNAKVYITIFAEKFPTTELIKQLNEEAGYFRHEISSIMTSKGDPAIRFVYDESIERADRLGSIIDSVSDKNNSSE